jgi:superfamily I DNA and/or RNA helicase
MLDEHFRSDPHIISFSNEQFYNGKIRIMTQRPVKENGVAIQMIYVKGQRSEGTVNSREIEAIFSSVEKIIESSPAEKPTTIGILCPFRDQVDAITKELAKHLTINQVEKHKIVVGTAYRTSIPRKRIEDDFIDLIKKLRVKPKAEDMVLAQLFEVWKYRADLEEKNKKIISNQITKINEEIEVIMKRLVASKSGSVIKKYEEEVEKLDSQKRNLELELKKQSYSNSNFEVITKKLVKHLREPVKMLENKDLNVKRLLLNMYFSQGLPYDENLGFQTPNLPIFIKLLTQKQVSKNSLVELIGMNGKR